MIWVIAGLILLCAAFDGMFTYRRMKKYGIQAELSPLAQKCMKEFGIGRGLIIALFPSNLGLVLALVYLAQKDLLLILLGARLTFVALALYSLKLEKLLDSNLK